MQFIIEGILVGIQQTSILEWIAVTTGIISVWCSLKENILVYPTGIVNTVIYIYLAFSFKLYADMGVNFYYTIMSIYGWYYWLNTDGDEDQVPVTINSRRENIISTFIFIGSLATLIFVLKSFTDSDVPVWDATTTSFAILGMWLMARKKLESWIAWILTNLISIPLYFYKGLILTSFQFLIFTIIAVMGYFAWRKSMRAREQLTIINEQ